MNAKEMVTPAIKAYYHKGRARGQTPPLNTCWVHEVSMAAKEDCVSCNECKLFQREKKYFGGTSAYPYLYVQ